MRSDEERGEGIWAKRVVVAARARLRRMAERVMRVLMLEEEE